MRAVKKWGFGAEVSLLHALERSLLDASGGAMERTEEIAERSARGLAKLCAVLASQGQITPGMALEICDASSYEIVDAPADAG
jgi:hypothetical protein